jgi:hypothetical protein
LRLELQAAFPTAYGFVLAPPNYLQTLMAEAGGSGR